MRARVCVRVYVCHCVGAYVCVCMMCACTRARVCMRVYVRACVRACGCARAGMWCIFPFSESLQRAALFTSHLAF